MNKIKMKKSKHNYKAKHGKASRGKAARNNKTACRKAFRNGIVSNHGELNMNTTNMTMEEMLELPTELRTIALEKLLAETAPMTEQERSEMKQASANFESRVISQFNKGV